MGCTSFITTTYLVGVIHGSLPILIVSAIVVSLWLDREHGTVCLSNCDNQTSALNNLGGYLRRICLAKYYGA